MQPRRIIPEHFAPDGVYPGRDPIAQPAEALRRIKSHISQEHEITADAVLSAIRRELALSTHGEDVPAITERELIGHIRDFLTAFDRGYFGGGVAFSDGAESAFVTGFREALRLYADRRQREMFEEDYRRKPADLWRDVHRVTYGAR